jgi:hypothetical protein
MAFDAPVETVGVDQMPKVTLGASLLTDIPEEMRAVQEADDDGSGVTFDHSVIAITCPL